MIDGDVYNVRTLQLFFRIARNVFNEFGIISFEAHYIINLHQISNHYPILKCFQNCSFEAFLHRIYNILFGFIVI